MIENNIMKLEYLKPNDRIKKILKNSNSFTKYLSNGDYLSYKIDNVKIKKYHYHIVVFSYKKIVTHIQIFSSSMNNDIDTALSDIKRELISTRNWSMVELINDKKMGYSYVISK